MLEQKIGVHANATIRIHRIELRDINLDSHVPIIPYSSFYAKRIGENKTKMTEPIAECIEL
ncbi:MAG: hypothetical protein UX00_C0005G0006 [Microgenomates group bacterium GW2011_GWB1_45_17]|nr:MAG: hypothetical protein UX00_C0005G0006 [Microgenomates group bacterium GW2011_GWB1_45_17]